MACLLAWTVFSAGDKMKDIVERLRDDAFWRQYDDPEWALVEVKLLEEAAAEISRLRSMTEWRTIESAPVNECILLGWPDEVSEGVILPDGRFMTPDGGNQFVNDPAKWLPLPSPPSTAQDKGE